MAFHCDPATLERLEWHRLTACLAREAATARGAEACAEARFHSTRAGVVEGLEQTSEMRALRDAEEAAPFGGIHDLRQEVAAARRGTVLQASSLARVLTTLQGAGRLRGFLVDRRQRVPRVADLAETLPELRMLARDVSRVVTPEGEVRDDASPELGRLRRSVRSLEQDIGAKMAAYLGDAGLRPHLQDRYVTSRESRPVLPVRVEARGRVRGIVHDVSSSGTTVFIEPEAVVDLGNRLRLAQLELGREIDRLLRQLTQRVSEHADELEAQGSTLEALDVAHARGRLSARLGAVAPAVAPDARLDLRDLRHPLLLLEAGLTEEEVVPNDVTLPPGVLGLVISGPNAGGKTVIAKAVGLALLAARAGLHVPCADGSSLPILDTVHADIGDEQDLRSGLSTFSARMSNLAQIVDASNDASLVVIDEIGEGTEPGEGAALAQAILEALVDRGARVIATTHFNRLKELAGTDERFVNGSAEFDPETLAPTYRVRMGIPGSSGATWVAERMGLGRDVIERAQGLIGSEDRKLEALTRDLSGLRQELEAERSMAERMRQDTESARAAYEQRLDTLRNAREQVLATMKTEVEDAFRGAREEVARIMRAVQRRDGTDGRAASRAHRELQQLRERTEAVERAHAEPAEPAPTPVDWDTVEPGARLRIEGLASEGLLVEGPNRSGDIVVRIGTARTRLSAGRVQRVLAKSARPRPHRERETLLDTPDDGDSFEAVAECDLRGLRVDEALDRADAQLQRLLGRGGRSIRFIHGHGTGALRSAIRAWLRDLPEVENLEPGARAEGGNGVTVVRLTH